MTFTHRGAAMNHASGRHGLAKGFKARRTEALLNALAKYPRLIERLVLVRQGRAAIGHPPEKVLEIL
ncbi:MAG: ArsC/Spx/MgsR family protein [Sulfuritalea sp.]|nr:ArsC/Spx/MgsR family protein [Sulfuritalea sp.]MDP1984674.1 ArsC/Spx/MgsR family protein [Sulfuritalea sp.]